MMRDLAIGQAGALNYLFYIFLLKQCFNAFAFLSEVRFRVQTHSLYFSLGSGSGLLGKGLEKWTVARSSKACSSLCHGSMLIHLYSISTRSRIVSRALSPGQGCCQLPCEMCRLGLELRILPSWALEDHLSEFTCPADSKVLVAQCL